MRMLYRAFFWIAAAALTLVVLFVANVGIHRLRGPTDAQEAALAKLEEVLRTPARGSNAFALLWLMRDDVADADIEALAASDVRAAHERAAAGESLVDPARPARPRLPEPRFDDPAMCQPREENCLARVRANPQATRGLLAAHARLLRRAPLLEAKDSYRNAFPVTLDRPFPDAGSVHRLRLAELALAWADGDRSAALAGVCNNIAAWRRMRHGSDTLIFSMLAVAQINDGLALFANLLAGMPAEDPVPRECSDAFAPIAAADVSLCTEMAGEYALTKLAIDRISRGRGETPEADNEGGLLQPLWFDARQSLAWRATEIAQYCSEDVDRRAMQDHAANPEAYETGILECASNVSGCILQGVAAPAYVEYPQRVLDAAAHLRLAATLIWLRESRDDPRPLAERFAARPSHLRSGDRASGIGEDGRSLWVDNRHTRHGARHVLALAPQTTATP